MTADTNTCGGVDNIITNPIHGYVTIDHANYCNLSNPSDPKYYTQDAIGMENNLFGDYIFINGAGLGTFGLPAVAIEADPSLSDPSPAPTSANSLTPGRRTFYRRYVTAGDPLGCTNPATLTGAAAAFWLSGVDCGGGDQREPLGLKYAARWFDQAPSVTSFFNVWRASSVPSIFDLNGRGDLLDLANDVVICDTAEPTVTLSFYDEDENTTTQGVCPSPCKAPKFNFPLETQRTSISAFSHPGWPAGWVSMEFFNNSAPVGGALDQAYVTYDFEGATQFLSAGITAAQLDPSSCQPLLVPVAPASGGVTPSFPVIPTLVGTGPS